MAYLFDIERDVARKKNIKVGKNKCKIKEKQMRKQNECSNTARVIRIKTAKVDTNSLIKQNALHRAFSIERLVAGT